MPTLESSIFVEASEPMKNARDELNRLKKTAIIFIANNPTLLFTRQSNAEKQIMIEYAFSEECVENPDARKEKLKQYIC